MSVHNPITFICEVYVRTRNESIRLGSFPGTRHSSASPEMSGTVHVSAQNPV